MAELSVYDNDPTLYLFTSLTAGSSHIVTATARIETILRTNKIPFKGVDTATDELARKLYGRRARGKKLPLLVKEGYVIADLDQIEEWNEYDEVKEMLGAASAPTSKPAKPVSAPADEKENVPSASSEQNLAIRQLGAEAAQVAAAKKSAPQKIMTTNPFLAQKINSPATPSPKDSANADTSGNLTPRSIPLPATPNPATSSTSHPTSTKSIVIPRISSKPVEAPPSMHIGASDPELSKPPISSTHVNPPELLSASPPPRSGPESGTTSPVRELHGSKIRTLSQEHIKQAEDELKIVEVSSPDEQDSQEEQKEKAKGGQEEMKT